MKLLDREFDGPFVNTDKLEERAGVFAVVCVKENRGTMIDVGKAESLKSDVENHDRAPDWNETCDGTLGILVHYVEETDDGAELADGLRNHFNLN